MSDAFLFLAMRANLRSPAYGESFDCMRSTKFHLWVDLFPKLLVSGAMVQAAGRLPSWLKLPFLALTIPSDVKAATKLQTEILNVSGLGAMVCPPRLTFQQAKVQYRLENTPPIPDFMGKLFDTYRSKTNSMSFYQLQQNSRILVMGGSETTSTALSGKEGFSSGSMTT